MNSDFFKLSGYHNSLQVNLVKVDDLTKRQWNEAVKVWVENVRSGRDTYREFMNGPAFKRMVGDVSGNRVLDLA